MSPVLEICADSYASARTAQLAGAQRVELCAALSEGGVTPSTGLIAQCLTLSIPIWPLIRPRSGDFLYTADEAEILIADVENCRRMGVAGIVTGALTAQGDIDEALCRRVIQAAGSTPVAFHRAIDMCRSIPRGVQQLINLGFCRVLSSGGQATAPAGAAMLAQLQHTYGSSIQVMPGSGITPANIAALAAQVHAPCYHASCKVPVPSAMQYHNTQAHMGSGADEYITYQASLQQAEAIVQQLNALQL